MKVKLVVKDDEKSREAASIIDRKLQDKGFDVVSEGDAELAIAVGGDGTFLRMVKECNFDSRIVYVGVNSGTLGFLQEVQMDEVDAFITEIASGYYKLDEVGVQEVEVYHKEGVSRFYSLNEIVLRDEDLKIVRVDVEIEGDLLERFVGDGIMIATSVGSTAYNLSYGGSIVMDTFSTLQITPMAPINSKVYRSLVNSVIVSSDKEIALRPSNGPTGAIVTVDGENKLFECVDVITTKIGEKKIKCMRLKHHNFPQKVNEKLLSNRIL